MYVFMLWTFMVKMSHCSLWVGVWNTWDGVWCVSWGYVLYSIFIFVPLLLNLTVDLLIHWIFFANVLGPGTVSHRAQALAILTIQYHGIPDDCSIAIYLLLWARRMTGIYMNYNTVIKFVCLCVCLSVCSWFQQKPLNSQRLWSKAQKVSSTNWNHSSFCSWGDILQFPLFPSSNNQI